MFKNIFLYFIIVHCPNFYNSLLSSILKLNINCLPLWTLWLLLIIIRISLLILLIVAPLWLLLIHHLLLHHSIWIIHRLRVLLHHRITHHHSSIISLQFNLNIFREPLRDNTINELVTLVEFLGKHSGFGHQSVSFIINGFLFRLQYAQS